MYLGPLLPATVQFGTTMFQVIFVGTLASGDTVVIPHLPFAGQKIAALAVIGEENSSFVTGVSNSSGLVAGGPSFRGLGIMFWLPSQNAAFDLKIANLGSSSKFEVIAL